MKKRFALARRMAMFGGIGLTFGIVVGAVIGSKVGNMAWVGFGAAIGVCAGAVIDLITDKWA